MTRPEVGVEPVEMRAQPASELVWRLANAGFAARCLQVVAELGVADRIDEAPVPVAVLASSCAVDIDALDRILRLLAVHGVFDRDADCYGHTPASRLLRSDCGRSSAHRTIGAGCPTPGLSAFGHVVINFRLRDPGAILIIGSIPRHTR